MGSTHAKRQREQGQVDRRKEKLAKRAEKKNQPEGPDRDGDEDPDLAGIVPGPQPPREDQLD